MECKEYNNCRNLYVSSALPVAADDYVSVGRVRNDKNNNSHCLYMDLNDKKIVPSNTAFYTF